MLTLAADAATAAPSTKWEVFNGYIYVLMASFLVSLVATPIMRRLALANGIIDRPNEARKMHKQPVAYLGGVAVYLGIMAGVVLSYVATRQPGLIEWHKTTHTEGGVPMPVPLSIILGMTVIVIVGMIDDVTGLWPRVKVGGQLFAAAALAVDDIGVKVAAGALAPIAHAMGVESLVIQFGGGFQLDLVYWIGTGIIAVFVLGACNASNLIDGLDGLLSGVTSIAMMGLLVIALTLAVTDDSPRDAGRIVLCLAVLGGCLGFLPHNFNPANIFLGDAGSLLLGFCTIVIILTLGERGRTELVIAGLIIYSVPIIDTVLAIIRRKMAGLPISAPDANHLHHILKRALGVRGAVFSLYGIASCFAVLGVATSYVRPRFIYVMSFIFACFIGVIAIKIARKKALEDQALVSDAGRVGAAPAQAVSKPAVPSHAADATTI